MFRSIVAAAVLAALPLVANAQSPNYGYLEGGIARADQYGDSLDGFAIKASLPFGDSWYGFLDYSQAELDEGRSIDLITLSPITLGAGYRLPVGDRTDLVFEAAYLGVGSELLGEDYINDGLRGAFGVRSRLASHVEIELKATVSGVEEFDTVVGAYAGALVSFNENWGLGLGYHYNAYDFAVLGGDGEVDLATIGLRYSY